MSPELQIELRYLVQTLHRCVHCSLKQCNHEPKRIFLSHVQQQQPGEKPHALNVANLAIVHRISFENIIKGALSRSMSLLEEHVRGEGASDVANDVEFSGGRFVENKMLP